MPFCVQCGKELINGGNFCAHCGAANPARQPTHAAHSVNYGDPMPKQEINPDAGHINEWHPHPNQPQYYHQKIPAKILRPGKGIAIGSHFISQAYLMIVVVIVLAVVVAGSVAAGLLVKPPAQTGTVSGISGGGQSASGGAKTSSGTNAKGTIAAPTGLWEAKGYSQSGTGGLQYAGDQTPRILFSGNNAYIGVGNDLNTVADFKAATDEALGGIYTFTYKDGIITFTLVKAYAQSAGQTFTLKYDGTYIYGDDGGGKYSRVN